MTDDPTWCTYDPWLTARWPTWVTWPIFEYLTHLLSYMTQGWCMHDSHDDPRLTCMTSTWPMIDPYITQMTHIWPMVDHYMTHMNDMTPIWRIVDLCMIHGRCMHDPYDPYITNFTHIWRMVDHYGWCIHDPHNAYTTHAWQIHPSHVTHRYDPHMTHIWHISKKLYSARSCRWHRWTTE